MVGEYFDYRKNGILYRLEIYPDGFVLFRYRGDSAECKRIWIIDASDAFGKKDEFTRFRVEDSLGKEMRIARRAFLLEEKKR